MKHTNTAAFRGLTQHSGEATGSQEHLEP